MYNLIIGAGNTGHNIIKLIAQSKYLTDTKLFAIDSITSNVSANDINRINYISIMSDEKNGSGRNRDRAKAMYEFHDSMNNFDDMYEAASNSKQPVIIITSAAGGTGSGSTASICSKLLSYDIQVIPIIVFPNKNDPAAFHLNANDLLMELGEIGIKTYSIFENSRGDADYTAINNEIVSMIETILGKHYDSTDLDSIDDSDLDVILNVPGRLVVANAESTNINILGKELVRKVFSGSQPAWDPNAVKDNTVVVAESLKSIYANTDFKSVFSDMIGRFDNIYDEYRNIVNNDNDGKATASIIIAGLPRPNIRNIDCEFNEAKGISDGIKKSHRPSFATQKKAHIISEPSTDGSKAINKFGWKK